MRARLLVLAASLGLLAVPWTREAGRALSPTPREAGNAAFPAPPPKVAADPTPWPAGGRDPFRFSQAEPRAFERRVAGPTPAVAPPSPAPLPVRLVGLVRRSGALQAALAADGEVVLVSVGDRVGAFTVVSLDEEGSVRLRDPDGQEATLTLPGEP
jgi:Tfp pilus assembly protein PilP